MEVLYSLSTTFCLLIDFNIKYLKDLIVTIVNVIFCVLTPATGLAVPLAAAETVTITLTE